MKLRGYYIKKDPNKLNLNINYDKKSKGRPAWIQIKGLPNKVSFIVVHLGKKGKEGRRIQFYKTYLPAGLFLPIDYTKEEMKEFYNKFSDIYDKDIIKHKHNIRAAKFLCNKLRKYTKTKVSILDLGAGTGLITEIFFDAGFKDITLVDYSERMLDKAKKRSKLKNCKFILCDIKKLNLNKKYDVIISIFSLGSSSYFSEDEFGDLLRTVKKHLKPNGIIALIGHDNKDIFKREFKELESGVYTLNEKNEFYTDYFIGKKIKLAN